MGIGFTGRRKPHTKPMQQYASLSDVMLQLHRCIPEKNVGVRWKCNTGNRNTDGSWLCMIFLTPRPLLFLQWSFFYWGISLYVFVVVSFGVYGGDCHNVWMRYWCDCWHVFGNMAIIDNTLCTWCHGNC